MSAATIRVATNADAAGILGCLAAAFAPYEAEYTAHAYADTVLGPAAIHERLAQQTVYVAVEGAEVTGTIGWNRDAAGEAHIRGMAVRPDRRGSGLAGRLLAHAEAAIAAAGIRRICLDTTAALQAAIRFYERAGYVRTGRAQDFFGMALHEFAKTLD